MGGRWGGEDEYFYTGRIFVFPTLIFFLIRCAEEREEHSTTAENYIIRLRLVENNLKKKKCRQLFKSIFVPVFK